jgi:ATP-dependent DNA helicase PIF1
MKFPWLTHKHLMTGLDQLFNDIMQDDRHFGGTFVVVSGDFRQRLPIIPGVPEVQITNACLKIIPLLWNTVTKLGLTQSMRGRNCPESERAFIEQGNAFLLAMGGGALTNPYPEENTQLARLPNVYVCH